MCRNIASTSLSERKERRRNNTLRLRSGIGSTMVERSRNHIIKRTRLLPERSRRELVERKSKKRTLDTELILGCVEISLRLRSANGKNGGEIIPFDYAQGSVARW